jgi:Na+-transporting methylmalonyl-CoA/oxaloacetate decarboxylase gamma subunit
MYEGISGAIVLSLISFTMVFFILALLALLMVVLKKIMKASPEKATVIKKAVIPEKDRVISERQDEKESIIKEQENAGTLVAVISAAVASLMERPISQVKIINIKRSMPVVASPWIISGKPNVMSHRIAIISRKKGGF